MTETDMLARLAQHRALGSAPVTEHEWLVAHGRLRSYPVGKLVNAKGVPVAVIFIVLSGHIVIRVDRGAGSHKIIEWRGGDVGGLMPYSRGATPPNDSVAEEATECLEIPKEHLPELIRECPVTTAALVHIMLDRARQFTSSDHRDEKLVSLGKLAAGLAHELNNPASAVVRSAKTLTESLAASESAARRLGAARLSDAQLAAVDAVSTLCGDSSARTPLTAVARADLEDSLREWLADHGANEECATPLADAGATIAALDKLASAVTGDALDASLRWIAAGCLVRALSSEIESAAARIHGLVAAVKGFTYMDHAPNAEAVDIRRGINETLTMLGAKMRSKSVDVSVHFADDLPRAHAVGAELNQVWMNLLDNALDAVSKGGRVEVHAVQEAERVVVRVIDDGPGIPPEIRGRIFDPFFTTKGVGMGAGLGLDIVRRLLQRYDGAIEVESAPGRTVFEVRLPRER